MEKKRVVWRRAVLGEGKPVICVPAMGNDEKAICEQVHSAVCARAEVIELRVDSAYAAPSVKEALSLCYAARSAAPETALLFTLRTERDGGAGLRDALQYEFLLREVAKAQKREKIIDAIDCELSVGRDAFARIAAVCKDAGVSLVGSFHDFERTPPAEAILSRLLHMQELGADVCKIAVMPQNKRDVLTLMDAALQAGERLEAPLIAIAMGPMGALTRVCGAWMGSCLTFGAAEQASAPGQIDVKTLRSLLEGMELIG